MRVVCFVALFGLGSVVGCSAGPAAPSEDAGTDAGSVGDGAAHDAGTDAHDADASSIDSGVHDATAIDAPTVIDAAAIDSAVADAAITTDAATGDASMAIDGGATDMSLGDAGCTMCGGACVDTQTDPSNCNGCGIVCPMLGAVRVPAGCVGGRCTPCVPSTTSCGTSSFGFQETVTCDANGVPTTMAQCPYGCTQTTPTTARCNACMPGHTYCDGSNVATCASDGSGPTGAETPCANGCNIWNFDRAPHCDNCVPNTTSCSGNFLVTCYSDGSGTVANQCIGGGTCMTGSTGPRCVCTPGVTTCDGSGANLLTCSSSGSFDTMTSCPYGCGVTAGRTTARCNACAPNAASCSGSTLTTCRGDGSGMVTSPCMFGCNAAGTACQHLSLSNLPLTTCDAQATGGNDLVLSAGTMTINTDTDSRCIVVAQSGGPAICELRFYDVLVDTGTTLTVTGSRPLALVGTHYLTVNGTIDVGASGARSGPGASSTGNGTGVQRCGGGAGFGAMGGGGSNGVAPGGAAYGTQSLAPLLGGSVGGTTTSAECAAFGNPGAGGGAGGAIQLATCGTLTVGAMAVIRASGGGGVAGFTWAPSSCWAGGGGGGSGGGVLIEGASVVVTSGAVLAANGGGGASGPGTPGLGANGSDGTLTTAQASGGSVAGSGSGGSGGSASGAATAAADGGNGGGGAVGRIHIDSMSAPVIPSGVIVSPAATTGMLVLQ
jgi:hypothetical protein